MNVSQSMLIRNRTVFIFLFLIGLLIYLNTLNAPFHFDDTYYLKENLSIKSIATFWDRSVGDLSSLFRGRPFLLLTFLVNYKLGGLDTFGYHLLNLLIHVGNAFLLYLLLFRYVDPDKSKGYSLKALLVATLFLIHPINTESVTYISSRSSELSALFVLLSMHCFFRATERTLHAGYYLLSALFFLLGLTTKEAAIVLPALLLLFDYFFISKGIRGLPARLKYHLPFLLIICALSFAYVTLITMQPLDVKRPWLTHILTELKVFTQYLRLLAVPVGLNIDHDVKPSGFIDSQVFVSGLVLFVLLSVAVFFRKKYSVISFSLWWIFINMAPFLFMRLNDFMAERWLYLASVGFSIGFAELLMAVMNQYRRTGIAVIGAVLLVSGTLTVMRNQVYASPILLWEDAAGKSPEKYRPLLNLSSAYMENGDTARAIESAEQAIKKWRERGQTNRDIVIAHINLAAAYGTNTKKAEAILKSVENEASRYPEYYGVLGVVSMNAGKYKDAVVAFKKAIALSPRSASFLYITGICHEKLGQKAAARDFFVHATTVTPQTAQEYMAQGEAFSKLGNYEKASACFYEAVRTDPLDVSMRIYLATILFTNGYLDQAFEQFSITAKISPRFAPAYKGMGLVMLAKGQGGAAKRYFDRALELLPPESPERKIVLELRDKTANR